MRHRAIRPLGAALAGAAALGLAALALRAGDSERPPGTAVRTGSVVAAPALRWEDSFERDDLLSEKWGQVEQRRTDHVARTSTAHARDGQRSARFEVRDGDIFAPDERQQISRPKEADGTDFPLKEGDEFYIALSLWFDGRFPGREGPVSWQVFLAITSFDGRGEGPMRLGHGGTRGRLSIAGVDAPSVGNGYFWMNDTATAEGGWHDFVLHVKLSQNPRVGFHELFYRPPGERDYLLQKLTDGGSRRYVRTLLEPSALLKLGIYRDARFRSTSLMYADRLKIGTTFASVALAPGT